MATPTPATRRETDSLGSRDVPVDALWGIHTLRAEENFALPGEQLSDAPDLIVAMATVKQAAALTNRDLGLLGGSHAAMIVAACEQIRAGVHHEQFRVPLVQGGAGTSTNMAFNEVITNAALVSNGYQPGDYTHLDPYEHVNMGQSTNDVYPTALRLATVRGVQHLIDDLEVLRQALHRKSVQFADIVKMGRTQLQDAVPMTVGAEFGAFAEMIREDIARLRETSVHLLEINLGATAIGTGLNAHPRYAEHARQHLEDLTQLPVRTSRNLVEATQDCGVFVLVSAAVKRAALKTSKICNDLRLLSSGPRTGLNELNLPPRQAGSSIMPGKINPVIPELVNQVAFEVVGYDATISFAVEGGQLQLNPFEPVIAASLTRGMHRFGTAARLLATLCIDGITANRDVTETDVRDSVGTITALSPYLGYKVSARIAAEALATGTPVVDVVAASGLIAPELLRDLLRPEVLAAGGLARLAAPKPPPARPQPRNL